MVSIGGPNLYDREEIVKMVWDECLDRRHGTPRSLPVLALLGPRGSGKTAILNHLAARCEGRAAQPFVPVLDLERFGLERRGWQVITELAYELASTKWPQFGRMEFPRFTLGRMIVDRSITTDSPEEAQADIEELLRKASKREDKPKRVTGLIDLLPELLGLPPWHSLAEYLGASLLRRRPVAKLFRTGLEFYSAALQKPHNNGFSALVQLGRLEQEYTGNGQDTVTRVLCEALLADLTANYRHGFRPTNCLVLLDNVDTAIGHAFLTALVNAKTNRANEHDPLVAVVTSRRVDLPAPLLVAGGVSTDYLTLWAEMRTDAQMSFDDWADLHSARPKSWLYPVRLSDLSEESVQSVESDIFPDGAPRLASFVHRLTSGHPWGVTKVLEACGQLGAQDHVLGEDELRSVLEVLCPGDSDPLGEFAAKVLLLDDLGRTPDAIAWSAARDVVAAERSLPATAGLQAQVAARCWLVRQDGTVAKLPPALHYWIRRVLLHELARSRANEPSWSEVYEDLRHKYDDSADGNYIGDRYYYDIALERFSDAVRYLNVRFDELDAEAWVVEFNQITSAPHEHISQRNALTEHGTIVKGLLAPGLPDDLPASDPHGERWMTMVNMTVARWVWSDPLRDPKLTMSPIIANGYRDLARRSPLNQLNLVAEADRYARAERF